MRRFLTLLLICAMLLGLMPRVYATRTESREAPLTPEDYVTADLMWQTVRQRETQLRRMKAPVSKTVEALIAEVTSSPYYAHDSLIRNGDHFFWETTDGIPCGYSPRLAEQGQDAEAYADKNTTPGESVITTSYGIKGGYPKANDVFLIQPYYGIDQDFTEQYVTEANRIASALNGTATVYRTTDATIDNIAHAIETGAVVIFDSHGDTDYAKGSDYVTGANTSYICLQTNAGLTSQDYEVATGPFGAYYHAYYAGSYGTMKYYCVDGTAIANHMDSVAPNSMLWMAICLGMATDGLQAPLRAHGVEVVYGYSQSVTFQYDYDWEEAFWSYMRLGKTVGESIAYMKEQVGQWDWCHDPEYDTVAEARIGYSAFPIVVSSEDVYPGHGNVDDLQSVMSTWSIISPCVHEQIRFVPAVSATCTESGNIAHYLCDECGALFRDKDLTERINRETTILPAVGHSYTDTVTTEPACTLEGVRTYTCTACGHSYTEQIPAPGHVYVEDVCTGCGGIKPLVTEFTIGQSGTYVLAAKVNDKYFAMPNNYTSASGKPRGIEISVEYGYVDEAFAGDVAVELTYVPETGTYTIGNGEYYLRYPSSTNIGGTTSPYYWTVTEGVNGSWQFVSQTSARGLIYRASGYNSFGGYYLPNVKAGGREYFDLEVIPVAAPKPGDQTPIVDDAVVINHSLNLASDISVNYAVLTSMLDGYDSFTLHCKIPIYADGACVRYETVVIEPELKGYFYYFTLKGITAVQMGDIIEAELHMSKDGKSYCSTADQYSVADYAYSRLNKEETPDLLKKLCAELLRYGSYAQQFKNYRTDSLVDSAMTQEHSAMLTDMESVTFNPNNRVLEDLADPTVTWAGKTLNLESKVVMRFVVNLSGYEGDPSDLELKVSYTNYLGEEIEAVLPAPELYMPELQYYAFDMDLLLAAELRSVVTAAVYCGDTRVSPTVEYSPDAYAIGKSGMLLTLCKALMAYSDTALAYFTQQ